MNIDEQYYKHLVETALGEKLDRGLLNKIIRKDVSISRDEFEKML